MLLCDIFIGKVFFICLRVSVNLVYKFPGKPFTTTVKHNFSPNGLKFHRGSWWVSILSWLNLKANKDYVSYKYVTQDSIWSSFSYPLPLSHMEPANVPYASQATSVYPRQQHSTFAFLPPFSISTLIKISQENDSLSLICVSGLPITIYEK